MIKKKAFTLIELLAVITILGIIIAIAVPNVTALIYQQKLERYKTYEKYIEIAANEFIDRYKSDFNNSDCLAVEYATLLSEDILVEDNITCDKGIVKLIKDNNGYIKEYYLNCSDKANGEALVSNFKHYDPSTCNITTGAFKIVNAQLNYEDNNQIYNGEWTNRNIIVSLEVSNPYGNPVSRYEMSFDGGVIWQDKGSSGKIILNTEINSNVKVRAYDSIENKYSNESSFSIKIDKTKPVISSVRPISGSNLEIFKGTSFDFVKNMTIVSSDNLSGIKRVWVTLGNKEIVTAKDLAEGYYTVYYSIEDNAGNVSENAKNIDFKIFYTITKYRTSYSCNCLERNVCVRGENKEIGFNDAGCPVDPVVGCVCCEGFSGFCGVFENRCGFPIWEYVCYEYKKEYYNCQTCWVPWTTTPCSGGNCQTDTCRADGPEGECNKNY